MNSFLLDNQFYIVLSIALVSFLSIGAYLFFLDKKITVMEKEIGRTED